jgi:antitoxin HicB
MDTKREFEVVLQPEDEGGFSVFVPGLPGCVSQGETREEALAMIKEAIEGYLESLDAHGDPIPKPTSSAIRTGRTASSSRCTPGIWRRAP